MKVSYPDIPANSSEFITETPEIFADFPWIRYGETRRTSPQVDPLSGSIAQADLPLGNTYDLLQPPIDRETFMRIERKRSATRIAMIMSMLCLKELARPRPEYATNLLDDSQFDTVCHTKSERAFADAVHTNVEGRGIAYSPADCPLLIVADPTEDHQNLTVVHAGYKSLAEDIIKKTLSQLPLKIPNTHVYVSPHALSNYPIYGSMLDKLEKSPVTRYHLGPLDEEGNRNLNFAASIVAQLGELGIKETHIAISPDNSLTDPTLYSQRNWKAKGVNGRNAVMAGIVHA